MRWWDGEVVGWWEGEGEGNKAGRGRELLLLLCFCLVLFCFENPFFSIILQTFKCSVDV